MVRAHVFERDGGRCRHCGRIVQLLTDDLFQLANCHEIQARSQGGSPVEPANVVCLCAECHRLVTGVLGLGKALRIDVLDRDLGANGLLRFRRQDGTELVA